MKKINFFLSLMGLSFLLASCESAPADTAVAEDAPTPLVEAVLSAEEQAALTPDMVIDILKEGNKRFEEGTLTARDHSAQVRNATLGQFPKAAILSCLDSRVPVEDIFDRGIGDLFVGRVAGNFVNVDQLGSMEFACNVSGAKVIMVLGHEYCGAVIAAIAGVELGNITEMLTKINPAIDMVTDFEGERSADNPAFVHEVCMANIRNNMNQVRIGSPILKEMEDNGELKIIGGLYNMTTGAVTFIED
jgi:carbonic anhydrase